MRLQGVTGPRQLSYSRVPQNDIVHQPLRRTGMNIAVTRAAEGFARRAFTVDEILRMVEAGIIAD